jgi:hypothetical protein
MAVSPAGAVARDFFLGAFFSVLFGVAAALLDFRIADWRFFASGIIAAVASPVLPR